MLNFWRRAALAGLLVLGVAHTARADPPSAIVSIVSGAAESNHLVCGGTGPLRAQCALHSVYVTTGTTAGYLMTLDAAAVPAAGGAAIAPRDCIQAPANATTYLIFNDNTLEISKNGLVVIFSTTGCFTNTASATAYFKVRAQ